MIKNIIFDWSGTLSEDIIPTYKAVMIVFEKIGLKKISFEKFLEEYELPYMKFYERYIHDMTKEQFSEIYSEAIHSVEEPKAFPGTKKFLEFIHKKGIKMALLSSLVHEKMEKEIENYGFSKFFVDIKGSVHDKREAILDLIEECKFKENETAFVGDTRHDIETGKKANLMTIGVNWGYEPKEKLEKANPDHIVESFDELKELILK